MTWGWNEDPPVAILSASETLRMWKRESTAPIVIAIALPISLATTLFQWGYLGWLGLGITASIVHTGWRLRVWNVTDERIVLRTWRSVVVAEWDAPETRLSRSRLGPWTIMRATTPGTVIRGIFWSKDAKQLWNAIPPEKRPPDRQYRP